MGVDWGQAGMIGGLGFGLVFFVLSSLAVAMWFVGWAFRKFENIQSKPSIAKETRIQKKKGPTKKGIIPEHKPKSNIDDFDSYE